MVFWAKYAYYHVKKSQNVNTKKQVTREKEVEIV